MNTKKKQLIVCVTELLMRKRASAAQLVIAEERLKPQTD